MKKKLCTALALLLCVSLLLSGCGLYDGVYKLTRWVDQILNGETHADDETVKPTRPEKPTQESGEQETDKPTRETDPEEETQETEYSFHEDFKDFTEEVYGHFIGEDTLNVHFFLVHPEDYGLSTAPVRWSNIEYGEEAVEEFRAYLDEIEDGLQEFDYEELTEEEQLIYDSLGYFIETERMGLGLELYYEPLGPNTGLQAELPVTLSEYAFYTKQDIDEYLELCLQLPDYFRNILDFEKAKKDAGLFMQDALLNDVIDQCDSFIKGEEDSFLYASFERRLDTLSVSGDERTAYIEKNKEAIAAVYDAYELLRDGLKKLGGDDSELAGLARLPEGKAYYEYLVRSGVGSGRTPDEMIDLMEDTIDGAIQTLQSCYQKDYFVEQEVDSMSYPSTDPALIMRMLIEKSQADFPALSDVDYRINYVDASLRDYLSPAFYFIAPFDDDSTNNIYINAEKGQEDEDIFIVLAHEGYPGHLYQTNYLKDHSVYVIRQFLEPTGYSEGWAKYVEFMAYDFIDDISETAAEYLRANALATICIHARVDLGIHYEGWDLDDIEDYVGQYFNDSREVAEWMMSYISGDPGGYLDYAVGVAEIYGLLNEADKSGDYDLYEFHERLLDLAGAPFPVIEKYMFD